MSLIVKETGGGITSPIEAGSYVARCVGVVELGIQHNDFNGKDQERVQLIFELPTERIEVDGEDKPRWLSKEYTASLHERSNLRKELNAWRGKPFTPEELAGFDLANVLKAPCMLTIQNEVNASGYPYAKIAAISKTMKGIEVPPLENEPIKFDMDAADAEETLKLLPEWIQKKVQQSVTWQSRTAGRPEIKPIDVDAADGELPF